MPDLLIRRCTLRIVRRGGWSWGADPRRLLNNAVEAVPGLIASRLAELLKDAPDGAEITHPIQIRVPVRLGALSAKAVGADAGSAVGAAWIEEIERGLREALAASNLAPAPAAASEDVSLPSSDPAPLRSSEMWRDTLIAWRRSGVLQAMLMRLDERVAAEWLHALASDRATRAIVNDVRADDGASNDGGVAAEQAGIPRTSALVCLLEIARRLASIAEGEALRIDHTIAPDLAATADMREPEPAETRDEHASTSRESHESRHAREPRVIATAPPLIDRAPTPVARRPLIDGEIHVHSALPWLLLGPLSRIGYLRRLRAVLALRRLDDQAHCFAAALAYKLTAAADRAWQKSAAVERMAATFAARRDPAPMPYLHRFAHRIASACPLLDAEVAHAIVSGRHADDPWIVQSLSSGSETSGASYAALDPEGLFPAWWSLDAAVIANALRAAPGAGVIVSAAASPQLLKALDDADVRFFTQARPGRGETWSRLSVGASVASGSPWWSNSARPIPLAARRYLARWEEIEPRVETLGEEFGVHRMSLPLAQSQPRDESHALERAVTLAAGVALGTIAWMLWRTREPVDPLLALSRFEDLDARVRFDARAVRVVVPMGRRYRDLYDAGLMTDVPDVPWLDGRTLEFSGG